MFIARHYIINNKVSQMLSTSLTIIFKSAQLQQDCGLTMLGTFLHRLCTISWNIRHCVTYLLLFTNIQLAVP